MQDCPKCGHNVHEEALIERHFIHSKDKKRVKVKIKGRWVWKMVSAHVTPIGPTDKK
jgi:hypothetical protein